MRRLFLVLFYLIPWLSPLAAQAPIQFYLADTETKEIIEGAHCFLANTSYGCFSDDNGLVNLAAPAQLTEDLVITHISYENIHLGIATARSYSKTDTIWMKPNKFILNEMVVQAKKSSVWKRRYKKFKKGFLGNDEIAKKCKILNPEVLLFSEEDGILSASAIDLIEIDNKHLGYKVLYSLSYFKIKPDGSMVYSGKAKFTSYQNGNFSEPREKAFLKSTKYFFKNLLANNLEAAGYELRMNKSVGKKFIPLQTPPTDKLIKKLPSGQYKFFFPEFIEVINNNIKTTYTYTLDVRTGGVESEKFSVTKREQGFQREPAVSYIYKNNPYLLLNEYGNILNSRDVKEFGYWANLRIAHQLPFEYGNAYEPTKITSQVVKDTLAAKPLELLQSLIYKSKADKERALVNISDSWDPNYLAPLIELLRISSEKWLIAAITDLLQTKTGQKFSDYYSWISWLWTRAPSYDADYWYFKAEIYKNIDPKFKAYFENQSKNSRLRLDEVLWGGVKQDGIPPLRNPKMLAASEAGYLADTDLIFGLYIKGEARAYPKRILAWHEFFTDTIAGISIAGVYCTLCGTVIAYDSGKHELGTSGFLYRSNKLMYDKATQSLWSTIEGQPAIGPLANKNIVLNSFPITTTGWATWKKRHPQTTVLSLETGYDRNYDEGVAYKDYFTTDKLMFPVPHSDLRLKNKDEVLIIRAPNYEKTPVAISIDFLKRKKMIQTKIGDTAIIALSDKEGIIRAYEATDTQFDSYNLDLLKSQNGIDWRVTEDDLLGSNGKQLHRLPSHNIFWFAWVNNFPNTELIK